MRMGARSLACILAAMGLAVGAHVPRIAFADEGQSGAIVGDGQNSGYEVGDTVTDDEGNEYVITEIPTDGYDATEITTIEDLLNAGFVLVPAGQDWNDDSDDPDAPRLEKVNFFGFYAEDMGEHDIYQLRQPWADENGVYDPDGLCDGETATFRFVFTIDELPAIEGFDLAEFATMTVNHPTDDGMVYTDYEGIVDGKSVSFGDVELRSGARFELVVPGIRGCLRMELVSPSGKRIWATSEGLKDNLDEHARSFEVEFEHDGKAWSSIGNLAYLTLSLEDIPEEPVVPETPEVPKKEEAPKTPETPKVEEKKTTPKKPDLPPTGDAQSEQIVLGVAAGVSALVACVLRRKV